MDVEYFLNMMVPFERVILPPVPTYEPIVDEGQLWDPETGQLLGTTYVQGYNSSTKPTFSRYSRRARFFSHVLDFFQYDDTRILKIMKVFDHILAQWKVRGLPYKRVYFLNVRCLIYMITTRLKMTPPFEKTDCLRDMKRYRLQEKMFNGYCKTFV